MNSNSKIRMPHVLVTTMLMTLVWGARASYADAEVRSQKVKFQDLNMDSPAGVKELYVRIHTAAKRVCYESDPLRQPIETACIAKAQHDAVENLNMSQLTAYYKMKTGDHSQPLVASR